MPKPKFITQKKNADYVFDVWLARIKEIEKLISSNANAEMKFDTVYLLFPLLDSISYTLFNNDAHKYLVEMGLSVSEAALLIKVFRDGFIHNCDGYDLEYQENEVIECSIIISTEAKGVRPYYPGCIDKKNSKFNEPAEEVIIYENPKNKKSFACLLLDRLLMKTKYDLEKRKEEYPNGTINVIVGKKMEGKKPKHK